MAVLLIYTGLAMMLEMRGLFFFFSAKFVGRRMKGIGDWVGVMDCNFGEGGEEGGGLGD